jgi:rhodanese-related sulfurtransferase
MNEQGDKTTVKADEARLLAGQADAVVVDVSTTEEWRRIGNIPGAVMISADDVESQLESLPDRDKVLVVCPDGERSAEVADRLRDKDVEAVSLEGGMQAWADEDLPLQPSEDPALTEEPEPLASDPIPSQEQRADGESAPDEGRDDESAPDERAESESAPRESPAA